MGGQHEVSTWWWAGEGMAGVSEMRAAPGVSTEDTLRTPPQNTPRQSLPQALHSARSVLGHLSKRMDPSALYPAPHHSQAAEGIAFLSALVAMSSSLASASFSKMSASSFCSVLPRCLLSLA